MQRNDWEYVLNQNCQVEQDAKGKFWQTHNYVSLLLLGITIKSKKFYPEDNFLLCQTNLENEQKFAYIPWEKITIMAFVDDTQNQQLLTEQAVSTETKQVEQIEQPEQNETMCLDCQTEMDVANDPEQDGYVLLLCCVCNRTKEVSI